MSWLFTSWWDLPWWAMVLWVTYTIYFVCRVWRIGANAIWHGVVRGYKESFLDGKTIYLGHIVWMIFDIPPTIVGSLLPFVRDVFTLKVYTFRDKEEKK
ncbi:hypothetical protein D3C74_49220 [compost metagenome]